MESVTRVEILDEVVCIAFCSNTLAKGMDPSVLAQLCVNSRAD